MGFRSLVYWEFCLGDLICLIKQKKEEEKLFFSFYFTPPLGQDDGEKQKLGKKRKREKNTSALVNGREPTDYIAVMAFVYWLWLGAGELRSQKKPKRRSLRGLHEWRQLIEREKYTRLSFFSFEKYKKKIFSFLSKLLLYSHSI
jgi:hypothetical protein